MDIKCRGWFLRDAVGVVPYKRAFYFMMEVEIFVVGLTPSVILTDATFLKEEGFPLRHFVALPAAEEFPKSNT